MSNNENLNSIQYTSDTAEKLDSRDNTLSLGGVAYACSIRVNKPEGYNSLGDEPDPDAPEFYDC